MKLALLLVTAVIFALLFWYALRIKGIDLWILAYLRHAVRPRPAASSGPVHVMVCVADHFEPRLYQADYDTECKRVDTWVEGYRGIASQHRDCDGRHPQHTFFYPEEEYRPEHIEKIAALCQAGFGDVEVHLHHDHDTAEQLRRKLTRFATTLHETHGLLRRNEKTGLIEYGFIHGNWALDNSGGGRACGVNNELIVLRETGCYADFTFPSAPDRSQPVTINSIYYATDDPERPKSHNRGVAVTAGGKPSGDLLLIQGPLTLNWKSRKSGILPRIENGELTGDNPPNGERVDLWVRQHVHVKDCPEWIFVKLHTHGANEANAGVLLRGALEQMWNHLEHKYNDGKAYCLHYVTAREMYNIVRAAETGLKGNPDDFRAYAST